MFACKKDCCCPAILFPIQPMDRRQRDFRESKPPGEREGRKGTTNMKWVKFRIKTTVEAEDIIISTLYDIGLEGA